MERKFHVSNRKPISKARNNRKRPGCIRLFVCPTTGGRLEISVSPRESVLGLKAALARKLRVLPTKITLIYKEKVLKEGCIQDYHIPDGSHVTLLPNMESGLSLHQTDKSIMQALDNLTQTQVNDFLSGRSPLMLAIHMGENMVFVQLQLSMLQGQGQRTPQPCSNVSAVSPGTAAVMSQTGLSPSTIAEAKRCLSQRLQRLQEINVSSRFNPAANTLTTSAPQLCQSSVAPHPPPNAPVVTASAPPKTTSSQTVFQHLQRLPHLPDSSASSSSPPPSPGAVINTMKHLGRGVYTGTFQGTLGPNLQDGNGQPRRSISTILHILNDLLVAAPHSPTTSHGQTATAMQTPCQCYTPAQPLTPPASPTSKSCQAPGVSPQDDPENKMLRDKMHRVQMMLAQRKEQRKNRRETNAPYTSQKTALKTATGGAQSTTAVSSASARMAAPVTAASTAERSDGVSHAESSNEQPNTYCKSTIEQDSLAV